MHSDRRDGLVALRFETLPADRLDALVSTRAGGISTGPYASLNLGLHVDDAAEPVVANRRRFFGAFGLALETSVWCRQVHRATVTIVDDDALLGRGAFDLASALPESDAVVTDRAGVPLVVLLADCVPVVLYDPEHHALGLAHAGWGGTVERIGSHTVTTMQERYGTDPSSLLAAIGPSIGPDRYEVGGEVIGRARDAYAGHADRILRPVADDDKALLDLWEANATDLELAGVPRERIEIAGLSTIDDLDTFYSHRFETRRGVPHTGRFATVVCLAS